MTENPPPQQVALVIGGKPVRARAGETILHAAWSAGLAGTIQAGCAGGVCGACTVSVRFKDERKGGADLACLRPVEEGMEVFPCPVDPVRTQKPVEEPNGGKLRHAYPTLDRCTKCGSCTAVCPMGIPVMDSVLRMRDGNLADAGEDFTTCIHCGLCRMVCEVRVEPHSMGMWVRRSLGMSRDTPGLDQRIAVDDSAIADREWFYLLPEDPAQRLSRAQAFRATGRL